MNFQENAGISLIYKTDFQIMLEGNNRYLLQLMKILTTGVKKTKIDFEIQIDCKCLYMK